MNWYGMIWYDKMFLVLYFFKKEFWLSFRKKNKIIVSITLVTTDRKYLYLKPRVRLPSIPVRYLLNYIYTHVAWEKYFWKKKKHKQTKQNCYVQFCVHFLWLILIVVLVEGRGDFRKLVIKINCTHIEIFGISIITSTLLRFKDYTATYRQLRRTCILFVYLKSLHEGA